MLHRKLLLLACLPLVAGPVYAEDSAVVTSVGALSLIDDYQITEQGYLKVTKESLDKMLRDYPDAKLRLQIADDPCLARMEEAMKAVEPWLGYTYKDDTIPADFKKAKALFYAVKKECWSKP